MALPQAQGEHPVAHVRMGQLRGRHRGFNLIQYRQPAPVAVVQVAHVRRRHTWSRFAAEEKLEQEFVAGRLVVKGQRKPLAQRSAPRFRDHIRPALAPFRPKAGWRDEAFPGQQFKCRIKLAVALRPKISCAVLYPLTHVVPGEVGVNREEAEDGVSSWVQG